MVFSNLNFKTIILLLVCPLIVKSTDLLTINLDWDKLSIGINNNSKESVSLNMAFNYWKLNMVDSSIEVLHDINLNDVEDPSILHVYELIKILNIDKVAQNKKSNKLTMETIDKLIELIAKYSDNNEYSTYHIVLMAANRLDFMGLHRKAIKLLEKYQFLKILNENNQMFSEYFNNLGVNYLLINQEAQASTAFFKVHEKDSNDWFSLVHLGYLFSRQNKYQLSSEYLKKGLNLTTKPEAKFYSFLSFSLLKLNKIEEARYYNEEAARKGLFISPIQRSTYNSVNKLRSMPWWNADDTDFYEDIKLLEKSYVVIKNEIIKYMGKNYSENGGKSELFIRESEGLSMLGEWRQLDLFVKGKKLQSCKHFPSTCNIIEHTNAIKCTRGQIKYSLMKPGTRVYPHTGPTNCRLRAHLGLITPEGAYIKVANETKTWKEGKIIILDDSFEHEVWHDGISDRLILIIDFWHPDIPNWERATLTPI